MITLCTVGLPVRTAAGVYEVIEYLRELGGYDEKFENFPEEITIPAIRICIPEFSLVQEIYDSDVDTGNKITLKILDRNLREPQAMLSFGDLNKPVSDPCFLRMSLVKNPFRDIKRIEEYAMSLSDDSNQKYLLIKACFDNMSITFLKWVQ